MMYPFCIAENIVSNNFSLNKITKIHIKNNYPSTEFKKMSCYFFIKFNVSHRGANLFL